MMEAVNRNENKLDSFRNELFQRLSTLENVQSTQAEMLRILISNQSNMPAYAAQNVAQPSLQQAPPPPLQSPYIRVGMNAEGPFFKREEPAYMQEQPLDHQAPPVEPLPDNASDYDENTKPRKQKQPKIPSDHTTGAARLLNAPGIKEHVEDIIGGKWKIKSAQYPMVHEERRGTLRLFGRGEGLENTPGYEYTQDATYDEVANDTTSETSSPAPYLGDDFGQVGGLTPPPYPSGMEVSRGIINSDGLPPLSRDVVSQLVTSYKDNMHILHPIFTPRQLDMLVEQFLKEIPETQAKPRHATTFVSGETFSRNGKRKHGANSPGPNDTPELAHSSSQWEHRKPGHPFRSMTSAIVLFVLALGKICLHKERIPDVARATLEPVNSPIVRSNGVPISPMQQSPSGLVLAPSPQDPTGRSRRTSLDNSALPGRERVKPKNIDLVPGLAYFAIATDILGNQQGGNRLQHVHANILAGLYHGQLGRVLESHAYIHQACYSLESVLRR